MARHSTDSNIPADLRFPRLSDSDRQDAIQDFAIDRLGPDADDETFDEFCIGCRVIYRDDEETGQSWYQVVDSQGHGDGSGIWTPVEGKPEIEEGYTETHIGTEKALAILAYLDRADEHDPMTDYYLRTTADGQEELWRWGDDEPLAVNHGHTSWHSPGYPPYVRGEE